jgi:hypothetical protein
MIGGCSRSSVWWQLTRTTQTQQSGGVASTEADSNIAVQEASVAAAALHRHSVLCFEMHCFIFFLRKFQTAAIQS